jgi:peroxiredoxin
MHELGEFVKHADEFKALDVQLLAISVDSPDKTKWVADTLHTPFPVLSDAKLEVMGVYGTRSPEYRNRLGISINTPTLVLIDKTDTIRWIHQATKYSVRNPVEDDLGHARQLDGAPKSQ